MSWSSYNRRRSRNHSYDFTEGFRASAHTALNKGCSKLVHQLRMTQNEHLRAALLDKLNTFYSLMSSNYVREVSDAVRTAAWGKDAPDLANFIDGYTNGDSLWTRHNMARAAKWAGCKLNLEGIGAIEELATFAKNELGTLLQLVPDADHVGVLVFEYPWIAPLFSGRTFYDYRRTPRRKLATFHERDANGALEPKARPTTANLQAMVFQLTAAGLLK